MKNIFFIAGLTVLASVSSCQNPNQKSNGNGIAGKINTTISVEDFERKLTKNLQLIDVRTPEEYGQGHLKGALNYNINSNDFENQLSNLDKNKPVLVYCLSGGRSSSAAELMAEKGFTEVYNMQGGIMKWNAANKPVESGVPVATSVGLTMQDFDKLVKSSKMVLIDYYAKWCQPCKKMAPMLETFAEKRKDKLLLIKIDADENKNLLKERGIESIPVLELYQEGKLVWKHEGEIDEAVLIKETKL